MTEHLNLDRTYRIVNIEKTDPPEGIAEGEWYHYQISQGPSKIVGKRAGTLASVTEHAQDYVDKLNQRATSGYSAYAARKSK